MNNNQRNFDILDIINIFSYLIAIENLRENRIQSEQNDVGEANDRQAHYLITELNQRFEEQNKMLRHIIELLENR